MKIINLILLTLLSYKALQAQNTWGDLGVTPTYTNGRVAIGANATIEQRKLYVASSQDAYALYLQNLTPAAELPQWSNSCSPALSNAAFSLYAEVPIATGDGLFSYAGFFEKNVGICGAELDLFDNAGYKWQMATQGDARQTLSFSGGDSPDAPLLLHGDDGSMEKIISENTTTAFAIKSNDDDDTFFEVAATGQVTNKEGIRILVNDNERPLEIYSSEKEENVMQIMESGKIFSTEIEVKLLGFPDYVFVPDYELLPLSELASYIKLNQHLPNIPSAQTVEQEGIGLGELQMKHLEKTEELTLYLLQLNERLNQLETENETLKKRIEEIEKLKHPLPTGSK